MELASSAHHEGSSLAGSFRRYLQEKIELEKTQVTLQESVAEKDRQIQDLALSLENAEKSASDAIQASELKSANDSVAFTESRETIKDMEKEMVALNTRIGSLEESLAEKNRQICLVGSASDWRSHQGCGFIPPLLPSVRT